MINKKLSFIVFLFFSSIFLEGNDVENSIEKKDNFKHARSKLETIVSANDTYVNERKAEDFEAFLHGQSPGTTVIMCSDSRVQPASLHDDPKGRLFTIRNIGNQIHSNKGSVDYGVLVLNTPLLLILGHTDCGAVKAVLKGYSEVDESIQKELSTINIGDAKNEKQALINNVNTQIEAAVKRYKDLIDNKMLFVVGGIYDMQNIFGLGYGALVFTNVNGLSSYTEIIAHPLFKDIDKLKVYNKL